MQSNDEPKLGTRSKHLVGFLTTVSTELDEIEKSGIEHCFGTVDESGLIVKSGLSYTRQIAGMWRRLTLEWMARSAEFFAPFGRSTEEKA